MSSKMKKKIEIIYFVFTSYEKYIFYAKNALKEAPQFCFVIKRDMKFGMKFGTHLDDRLR